MVEISQPEDNRLNLKPSEGKTIGAHSKAIRDLIFVSPKLLATGSYDNDFAIKLWEIPSFKLIQKLVGHKGKIRNLKYSTKLRILASSGDDCTVILWKRLSKNNWILLKTIPGKEFMTWGILFDDSRRLLFTGCSHYIEIFHMKKGFKKIRSIQIRDAHVYGIHVIYSILKYDDRKILSADNEKIILWDYIRGEKLVDVDAHSHYIYRLKMFNYLNVQYIVSCSEDRTMKFWKITEKINYNKNETNNSSGDLIIEKASPGIDFGTAITGLEIIEKSGIIAIGLSSGIEGKGKMILLDCKDKRKIEEYIFDDIGEVGCLCLAWEPKNNYLISGFWNGKLRLMKLSLNN